MFCKIDYVLRNVVTTVKGQCTDVFNKNEHSKVQLSNHSFMNDIVVSAVG